MSGCLTVIIINQSYGKGSFSLQQARNILKAQAKMLDSLNSAESIEGEIRLSMSSSVCSRYFKMISAFSSSVSGNKSGDNRKRYRADV